MRSEVLRELVCLAKLVKDTVVKSIVFGSSTEKKASNMPQLVTTGLPIFIFKAIVLLFDYYVAFDYLKMTCSHIMSLLVFRLALDGFPIPNKAWEPISS